MDLTQFKGYTPIRGAKPNWFWDGTDLWHRGIDYEDESNRHDFTGIMAKTNLIGSKALAANMELIAAAPALLDYARSLEATVKSLKERLEYVAKEADEDESKLEQANRELR